MSNSKTYKANCHCAAVKYTIEVSPPLEDGHEVGLCNCSICSRDGKYNIYMPKDKMRFVSGEDAVKVSSSRLAVMGDGTDAAQEYPYHSFTHAFCPNCGTSMWVRMADENHEQANIYALNVRSFQDVDLENLKVKKYDMKDKAPHYQPGW